METITCGSWIGQLGKALAPRELEALLWVAQGLTNRVGGGFTAAVLSHHRAYGSVHGGSGYAAKPVNCIQYRDQSESIP